MNRRIVASGSLLAAVVIVPATAVASGTQGELLDCAALARSARAVPAGYAEQCLGILPPTRLAQAGVIVRRDPTDIAFALELGFVSSDFVSHALNDFPGQTAIGVVDPLDRQLWGFDFDPTATTLYALDNLEQELGTVDLTSGAFTPIGSSIPLEGHNWTGLTIDPVDGTFYASSAEPSPSVTAALYVLDPETGEATLIGEQTTAPGLIEIAMNCEGVMYGHDIVTDSIYTIDPATAAATLIGATEVNANFAQGMDFDNADGTLYAYFFLGDLTNRYGTIDLATGVLTPLDMDDPPGEFEGATQTVCPAPALAFSPSNLDFGGVDVGATSPPQIATLANSGDAAATELSFSTPGGGFTADVSACGDVLPAGGSCDVQVTFAPSLVGAVIELLDVTSAEGASASLLLQGSGQGETRVPVALTVDATPLLSDGNQVFEPGECVEVAPAWLWLGVSDTFLDGAALAFAGPEGPAYDLIIDSASYGEVGPGGVAACQETGSCYQVQIGPSGVSRPATHWDASLDEEVFELGGGFSGGEDPMYTWTLHVGESFADVPRSSPFYRSVETLLHRGVTGGCSDTEYCPADINSRGQMPVFVLKALEGAGYTPPACQAGEELFGDVPATSPFCPWIEELASREVVVGCGGGDYCPGSPVTRAQMGIFLLKALEGAGYAPPACSGVFTDVACPSTFADWIEELFHREITSGCSGEPLAYCPGAAVSRAQMAVFVTTTFGLELYGP